MIKVGIVGCGSIAGVHAWALSLLQDIEPVAFADIRIERAKRFSDEYTKGRAAVYDSLTEMLREAKPDVVHICTPHYLHVPMAIEAWKSGAAFFSEKPPAISMEQFDLLSSYDDGMHRGGFCFQNRYNATIRKVDELLAAGKLGEVIGARAFVTWRRDKNYYETDWKGVLATEGGGALINQSIHTLDLILRYLGKPEEVSAGLSNHHLKGIVEVEDTVEAMMTFPGGKRACFYASNAYVLDAPVIFELQCEKGSITIIDKSILVRDEEKKLSVISVEETNGVGKDYWGNGHLACISDFYDRLKRGEPFRNDLAGVRNTMETMMRIYDFR